MFSLAPYTHTPSRLEDYLPWAILVAPGIVLNKDGSFQTTVRLRGPDIRSATRSELAALALRANNVFTRLGQGWTIWMEARRQEISIEHEGEFPDDISRLIDAERSASLGQTGRRFETLHYMTLQWTPPGDAHRRASAFLFSRTSDRETSASGPARDALEEFRRQIASAFALVSSLCAQFEPLDDDETLVYLKSCVSPRLTPIRASAAPALLDSLLVDAPLTGGIQPRLGDLHLRTLTITGFPPFSFSGMLNELSACPIAFRWMTRYIRLSRDEAIRELGRKRREWFSQHKSFGALLRETLTREPSAFSDPDALAKSAEADAALEELGADRVGFGYLTSTLTVLAPTAGEADQMLARLGQRLESAGFGVVTETFNAVEAWLSSLPGHVHANVRWPLVSTLNFVHIAPLASVWAGEAACRHLNGPPLILAETEGATPFRLNLHVGDVGHTMIVGPTGAGKSVLLAFLALQWRRYARSQVFIFDRGGSARAAVLAMGGAVMDLSADGAHPLQPLAGIDTHPGRMRALEWICELATLEGVSMSPARRETIWNALGNLAGAPPDQRHLTGLRLLLSDREMKDALLAYTHQGPYGTIFDGASDPLRLSDVSLFEMQEVLSQPKPAALSLHYLFSRLEERFDGRPTLILLDEAWTFLDTPIFASRLKDWLKTLRKKNVAVVFATQSLADIATSSIAPQLIESCPTRIFLPNDRASEPQQQRIYEAFGLNSAERDLLAAAIAKRDYYYQSPLGRRLFQLSLGEIALSVCAASDPDALRLVRTCEAQRGDFPFWRIFLAARGLGRVLEAIDAGSRSPPPSPDERAFGDPTPLDISQREIILT
jgi:type IV secretion system protein VirB4